MTKTKFIDIFLLLLKGFEQGSVSVGMAMAVICVLLTTTALIILNYFVDREKN